MSEPSRPNPKAVPVWPTKVFPGELVFVRDAEAIPVDSASTTSGTPSFERFLADLAVVANVPGQEYHELRIEDIGKSFGRLSHDVHAFGDRASTLGALAWLGVELASDLYAAITDQIADFVTDRVTTAGSYDLKNDPERYGRRLHVVGRRIAAASTPESEPPRDVGRGMPWRVAKKKAEDCVKNAGWPGSVNRLAKLVGCSPKTISKVVEKSKRLAARKAEYEAEKGKAREVRLSDSMLEDLQQGTEDKILSVLTDEQTQERDQEQRQFQAAQRGRTR